MEMAATLDFWALTKVHNFKGSDNLHTHRRHMSEETYTTVFSSVEYHIFNHFLCEKHHTNLTTFQVFEEGGIFMF